MRCAILSDIHSNLEAFQAVLKDIEARGGADEVWCAGDVVGYGPNPKECIALLREHRYVCVVGNHDWGAAGRVDISYFNTDAATACLWTGRQLDADEIDYLENLPMKVERDDFTIVHGSPRDPIWEYLLTDYVADINFKHFQTRYCLVGHSHVPFIFEERESGRPVFRDLPEGKSVKIGERRLIINPGSVGQPRDGNAKASYILFDSEKKSLIHYRVPYKVIVVQDKMRKVDLPPRLIQRLSYGL